MGKYVLLTHKDLDRAEAWFARRGEPFVLFGRFIPLLRSFVSFAAGLGEMAVAKFLLFTVIGCAIWCTALTSFGYALGSSYSRALKAFSYAGYVAAAVVIVAVVFILLAPAPGSSVRSGAEGLVSRPPRAPARRAALEASGHLERTEMWNGLHRGDPVIVVRPPPTCGDLGVPCPRAQPAQRHRIGRGGRGAPG